MDMVSVPARVAPSTNSSIPLRGLRQRNLVNMKRLREWGAHLAYQPAPRGLYSGGAPFRAPVLTERCYGQPDLPSLRDPVCVQRARAGDTQGPFGLIWRHMAVV